MAGFTRGFGRGFDYPVNIGSTPGKQGKFRADDPESGDFGVLDLALARTVNDPDRCPLSWFGAVTKGP
jgi:hypothetical protein